MGGRRWWWWWEVPSWHPSSSMQLRSRRERVSLSQRIHNFVSSCQEILWFRDHGWSKNHCKLVQSRKNPWYEQTFKVQKQGLVANWHPAFDGSLFCDQEGGQGFFFFFECVLGFWEIMVCSFAGMNGFLVDKQKREQSMGVWDYYNLCHRCSSSIIRVSSKLKGWENCVLRFFLCWRFNPQILCCLAWGL